MRTRICTCVLLLTSILAPLSCGRKYPENVSLDTLLFGIALQTFGITNSYPRDGQNRVANNVPYFAQFGLPLNTSSLIAQNTDDECSGTVQLTRNNFASCLGLSLGFSDLNTKVSITPITNLTELEEYRLKFTTGIASNLFTNMKSEIEYRFIAGGAFSVSPSNVVLRPGAQLYIGTAYGTAPYTYSNSGGTLSSSNLYTASSTPGLYSITVVDGNGYSSTGSVRVGGYQDLIKTLLESRLIIAWENPQAQP